MIADEYDYNITIFILLFLLSQQAYAAFGKTAKFLNISSTDDLLTFKKAARQFCSLQWEDVCGFHFFYILYLLLKKPALYFSWN